MGAPGLDDVGERGRPVLEGGRELLQGGQECVRDLPVCRHVDGGREHVVRALPHVHVVVRMDAGPLPARLAEELQGAVGDHLVGVHVGRGPRPGLEDVDHELAIEPTFRHFRRGADDRLGLARAEEAQVRVHARAGRLDRPQRLDEAPGEAESRDGKVLDRARRLRPVVRVGGHRHLSHAVALDAGVGHGAPPRDGGVPISLWPKGKLDPEDLASGPRAADAGENAVRKAERDRLGSALPVAGWERVTIRERTVEGALLRSPEEALDVAAGRPAQDELPEIGRPDPVGTDTRLRAALAGW